MRPCVSAERCSVPVGPNARPERRDRDAAVATTESGETDQRAGDRQQRQQDNADGDDPAHSLDAHVPAPISSRAVTAAERMIFPGGQRLAIGLWSDTAALSGPYDRKPLIPTSPGMKGDAKMMKKHVTVLTGSLLTLACVAALTSCTSKDKTEPKAAPAQASAQAPQASSSDIGSSSVSYTPGEAGGMATRVIKSTATVSAIDPLTRRITLTTDDGSKATFTAPPEMHNFDQLHVGDKVNATLNEQLLVMVGKGTEPSETQAAVLARAPKGAKPGAMAAETFQTIATVKAIDSAKRQATLQFVDGDTAAVPVRKDVDLTKYKVGDSVLIRVTQQLTVLTEKP
jgi:hypothetical protein